ncbi:Nn.00g099200.m01.CDS01 [Neocucurbitaria sp. VM-36]
MASNEKHGPVTFGATVERPTSLSTPPPLRSPPSNDSTMSSATEEAAKKEWAIDPSNPYSAFYKHPEARRSLDASSAPQSKTHLGVTTFDLEAGAPLSAATTQQQPKASVDGRVKECTMWPSRQAVIDKRKTAQRTRGCAFFRNMTSKQRLWAKIVIGLLVVAAAVGLGVGISRAVGGGVWAGQGKSKEIPHS